MEKRTLEYFLLVTDASSTIFVTVGVYVLSPPPLMGGGAHAHIIDNLENEAQ